MARWRAVILRRRTVVARLAIVLRRWAALAAALVGIVGARVVAHDLGDATTTLDDLHAIAELNVAVVALGDLDDLAVVLLDGDLDTAATARCAAVAIEDHAEYCPPHAPQQAATHPPDP